MQCFSDRYVTRLEMTTILTAYLCSVIALFRHDMVAYVYKLNINAKKTI